MRFVSINLNVDKEGALSLLKNYGAINAGVTFTEKSGRPTFQVKEKRGWMSVGCRMVGGPTRDNGFLIGTVFLGRIKEKDGSTRARGIITTAPIYHIILVALFVAYVIQCVRLGGFNPVPPILLIFSLFLFKNEFKKQRIIAGYLSRAQRIINSK